MTAARRIGLASMLVLLVCAAVGTACALSYRDAVARLPALSARAVGQVTGAGPGGAAEVRWTLPSGAAARAVVPLAVSTPAAGTRTQIAYDPGQPDRAIIPGASLLAEADRARDGMLFTGLVAVAVLLVAGWQWASRRWVRRRPVRPLVVRRVRVQHGLLARSWLETEPPDRRWLPVHFHPVLLELPVPVEVLAHGDPHRHRLVAVDAGAVTLYPSGRVRAVAPRGRRTDSPTTPDGYARERGRAAGRLRRQLRVDAALLVPVPLVGVLWAYLDDGGFTGWLGACAVTGALVLWWAALRGADPS